MTEERSERGFADFFARPFELDLRSIALFRVGLGLLIILDLLNRALWLRAHYTDFGLMPRDALLDTLWDRAWLSVHLFSGTAAPTAILFTAAGLIAFALLIGYRTTLMAVLSWFLMISLHARNPMVLQGGDIVFRLLMFWAMFLPLGARWSVDAALDREGDGSLDEPDLAPVRCAGMSFWILVSCGLALSSLPAPNPTVELTYPVFFSDGAWIGTAVRDFSLREFMVGLSIVLALGAAVWIYWFEDEEEEDQETATAVGRGGHAYHSAGTIAFIGQLSFIYVFAALLKTGDEWWPELTATYYALSLQQFTTPLGDWLHGFGESAPWVLEVMTAGSLGLEAFGWLLLFTVLLLPVFFLDPIHRVVLVMVVPPALDVSMWSLFSSNPWLGAGFVAYFFLPLLVMRWWRSILDFSYRSATFFRILAILSFIGMHMGFAVTMRLGLFSYIVAIGWLALLPAWVWERLGEKIDSFGEGCTIRVRSAGGLVEKGARAARVFFVLPESSLQVGEDEDDDGEETSDGVSLFSVEIDGDTREGFAGLAALAKISVFGRPIWWLADKLTFPKRALRWVVGAVRERSELRRTLDWSFRFRPYGVAQTAVGSVLVVAALCGTFWWNVQTLDSEYSMTQPWRTLAVYVRLDQQWNMFAPYPLMDDGWYVMPGELRNGDKVSVFQEPHMEPVSWEKPADVSETYPSQRWRKYMMNIWLAQYSDQRLYYGRWVCRKWNSTHDREHQLMTYDIYFMKEVSTGPGKPPKEPEKTHLWSHHCFADPDDDDDSDESSDSSEDSTESALEKSLNLSDQEGDEGDSDDEDSE